MSCSSSEFIEKYFGALAEAGISAVILHGFEGLPSKWESDIDCSVPRSHLARIQQFGTDLADRLGWGATQPVCANLSSFFRIFFRRDCPEEFIQIDTCADLVHSGCFLATAEELQAGAREAGVFRNAAPAAEFACQLGKNLAKSRPIARVLPRLAYLAELDFSGCEAAFFQMIGHGQGTLKQWLGRDASQWDRLGDALRRGRGFGPRLFCLETFRLFRRWWFPCGIQISVLGPDGAGKSTLIDQITRVLGPYFRAVDYFHSRPHLLDPKASGGVVSEPHSEKPRSWLACVAKLFFYASDHCLGRLLRIRPGLVRNRMVIFDRDFHDIVVDPRRYRMQGVDALARAFAHVLPHSDLTFVLDAPPDLIHARKPELSIAELARQRAQLRKMAEGRSSWTVLDASMSADSVARTAIDGVLQRISSHR